MLRLRCTKLLRQLFSTPLAQHGHAASSGLPSAPTRLFLVNVGNQAKHSAGLEALRLYHRSAARPALCSAASATAFPWNWASACGEPMQCGVALRQFAAPAANPKPQQQAEKKVDSLEITEESYKAITDQIPQRPMGVVEGTSYSLIIAAAFAFLAFIGYQFVTNLLLEPLPYQCYNAAFEKLQQDPRITVRLGGDVRAWGAAGGSRAARQQIPHTIYKTDDGTEHVRLQFHMGGSAGVALVSADMYKGPEGGWQYLYLVVDVANQGSQNAQRLFIVNP